MNGLSDRAFMLSEQTYRVADGCPANNQPSGANEFTGVGLVGTFSVVGQVRFELAQSPVIFACLDQVFLGDVGIASRLMQHRHSRSVRLGTPLV